jgi:VIT1/CCC1 family predicted Fe2+/Mn2+ transporter
MKDRQTPLRPDQEVTRNWYTSSRIIVSILAGFLVGVFMAVLTVAVFPSLGDAWRVFILIAYSAAFALGFFWADVINIKWADDARKEGKPLIWPPRRF